jgi:hypothetical protein
MLTTEGTNENKKMITFVLPTKDSILLDLTGYDDFYVKDLKNKLFQQGIGIHPARMNLIYKHRAMKDLQNLEEFSLQPDDTIEVSLKILDVQPIFFTYDEFIYSVNPSFEHSSHIPVDTSFGIEFRKNLCHHIIHVESLLNRDCLKSIYSPDNSKNQSMVQQQHQLLHQEKQLYLKSSIMQVAHWTDYQPDTNILLLEIDETLELRFERILYNLPNVVDGTAQPDFDSWQRYTQTLPIDCRITVDAKYREFPLRVKLTPYKPLQYNTRYAVFLKCGVATIPAYDTPWSFHYYTDGIGWDKLIFFKTEKAPSGK